MLFATASRLLLTPAALVVAPGSLDGFHTPEELDAALEALHVAAPPSASFLLEIGTTIEGRPLRALCVGACNVSGAIPSVGSAPGLLITGLHHAREPTGMVAALAFVDGLLDSAAREDGAAVALLARRAVWIVPSVNPDGYAANLKQWGNRGAMMLRKNRRPGCTENPDVGVDLNRNYDFEFQFDDQGSSPVRCAEDYRGSHAFSEPESVAMQRLVLATRPAIALNWHSFGRFINLPYAVKDVPPPPPAVYDTFLNLAAGFAALTGFTYGHPFDGGLYTVNGEASDWMLAAAGTFAMSPELGPAMNDPFETGMWPTVGALPGLVAEALRISERAAWAAGALLEVPTGGLRLSTSSDGNVTVELTLRNNGVRDTDGEVLIGLVDGLAAPVSSTYSSAMASWAAVGLPLCGTPQPVAGAGLPRCLGAAAPLPAGLLPPPSFGSRLGRRARLLSHRPTLPLSERVLAVAHELRLQGSAGQQQQQHQQQEAERTDETEAAAVLQGKQRRLDLGDLQARVAAEAALLRDGDGGASSGANRRMPQAIDPLIGIDVRIAGAAASFVTLRPRSSGGGQGVLAAQHETVPIRLSLKALNSGGAAKCAQRATDAARGACGDGSAPPLPLALLVASDDTTCVVYGVSCTGALTLVSRGQSGCAPCALFRTHAWEAALAGDGGATGTSSSTSTPQASPSPSLAAAARISDPPTMHIPTGPPQPSLLDNLRAGTVGLSLLLCGVAAVGAVRLRVAVPVGQAAGRLAGAAYGPGVGGVRGGPGPGARGGAVRRGAAAGALPAAVRLPEDHPVSVAESRTAASGTDGQGQVRRHGFDAAAVTTVVTTATADAATGTASTGSASGRAGAAV